jgi:hypothetical protein
LLPKLVRALNEDVERHSKPVLGELEKRRVRRIAFPSDELADLLLADAGPSCDLDPIVLFLAPSARRAETIRAVVKDALASLAVGVWSAASTGSVLDVIPGATVRRRVPEEPAINMYGEHP